MRHATLVLPCVALIACGGGGSEPGVPMIVSDGTAVADGESFIPVFGVSTVLDSGTVVSAMGTGELHCGSIEASRPPPSGLYVNVQIPDAVLGVPSEHFFSFNIISGGDVDGGGSNSGSVEVTAVSDTAITLSVDYTDTVGEKEYALSGTFEFARCP